MVGKTDELGWRVVEDPIHTNDFHATLLHLFGFEADRFAFETNNRTMSLLDNQGGSVVQGLLA